MRKPTSDEITSASTSRASSGKPSDDLAEPAVEIRADADRDPGLVERPQGRGDVGEAPPGLGAAEMVPEFVEGPLRVGDLGQDLATIRRQRRRSVASSVEWIPRSRPDLVAREVLVEPPPDLVAVQHHPLPARPPRYRRPPRRAPV